MRIPGGGAGVAARKAAAAIVAAMNVGIVPGALISRRNAVSRAPGARIKTQTGQRYRGKAEAESFEGLPPCYGLSHAFC